MWLLGIGLAAMAEDGLRAAKNPVEPDSAMVYSIDNGNQTFHFTATLQLGSGIDGLRLYLGERDRLPDAIGQDEHTRTVTFVLDEADATSVAAVYGLPLLTRTDLGEGLSGRFSAGEWAVGGPQPVSLELVNQGGSVGVVVGGRQHGPRNDRFSFVLSREGVPIETRTVYNFGGRMGTMIMDEGTTHTITVDAADWAIVSEPGEYEVACTYETELWSSGEPSQWRAAPHQTWDLRIEQVITVTVL